MFSDFACIMERRVQCSNFKLSNYVPNFSELLRMQFLIFTLNDTFLLCEKCNVK